MAAWLLVTLLLVQDAAKKPIETAHLTVTTSVAVPAAPAGGGKAALVVDVTPKPKMHVYAPGQQGYIAITLTLDDDASFRAGKAKYPAGEKFFMPALNETQWVYAKPFRITQDVTLTESSTGPRIVKGRLRYQACDDKICYLPQTVAVEWTVGK